MPVSKLTAVPLACLLAASSTALLAQPGPPPQSIPKFTARTELVTVPVVVSRHGGHVAGLSKDDFTIAEDGQPKPIASFEEINNSAPSLRVAAPPPGVFTNEVASAGPVAMVVILLDLVNTPYLFQEVTRKRLLEQLQTRYRADRPTMLVALHPSGLRVLHDFTTDPQVLADILRRLKNKVAHDPALDNQVQTENSGALSQQIDVQQEYAALESEFLSDLPGQGAYEHWNQLNNLEATFSELQQLAHALSAVRGMKSLVWATGGFIMTYSPKMDPRDQWAVEGYVQTLQQLSAAGVSVFPIDTVLDTDNSGFSGPQSRYPGPTTSLTLPLTGRMQIVQNFMDIAQRTGGDYCLLRKDPDLCFRKALDYGSQYYLLSYYAQPSKSTRWRKIEVKVRGADLQVRARSGYFPAAPNHNPEERRKRDIAQAFAMPVESRGLPISVRWTGEQPSTPPAVIPALPAGPQPGQHAHQQPFRLGVSADALTVDEADHNHIRLSIVAAALDPAGKVLADFAQQLDLHPSAPELERLRRGGFAYSNVVEVPPHTARVRFMVRDDLGEHIGTVSAAPEASLPH